MVKPTPVFITDAGLRMQKQLALTDAVDRLCLYRFILYLAVGATVATLLIIFLPANPPWRYLLAYIVVMWLCVARIYFLENRVNAALESLRQHDGN